MEKEKRQQVLDSIARIIRSFDDFQNDHYDPLSKRVLDAWNLVEKVFAFHGGPDHEVAIALHGLAFACGEASGILAMFEAARDEHETESSRSYRQGLSAILSESSKTSNSVASDIFCHKCFRQTNR